MRGPASVGVPDEGVPVLELPPALLDAEDVGVRVTAELELESGVALVLVLPHRGGHGLRRALADGPVQRDAVRVEVAPEQSVDREAGDLAQDVPARHVQCSFDVGVALEVVIHRVVEHGQLAGVLAYQPRPELSDAGPHPGGVAGQVVGAQGHGLPHPTDPGVGGQDDHCAVILGHALTVGPGIRAVHKREVSLIHGNADYFHDEGQQKKVRG